MAKTINVIEVIQEMKNDLANHNRGITLLLQTLTRMQSEQAKMSNMLALMEQKLPPHVLIDLDAAAQLVSPAAASKAGVTAPIQPEDLNVPVAELQKEQEFEKIAEEQAAILATLQPAQPIPAPVVEEVKPTPAPAPEMAAIPEAAREDIAQRSAAILRFIGPKNIFNRALGPTVKVGGEGNVEQKFSRYNNDIAKVDVKVVVGWPSGVYKNSSNQSPQVYLKGKTYAVIVDDSLAFDPRTITVVDLEKATMSALLTSTPLVLNTLADELEALIA